MVIVRLTIEDADPPKREAGSQVREAEKVSDRVLSEINAQRRVIWNVSGKSEGNSNLA